MRRQYGGWRRFELTGHVTPMHSRRSSTWSAAFRARLRNCRRRMHTRGGRDGATGGGHRSSGVTPRGFPVGRTSMGRRGGGEAEGCPRRGDRAGRHLGPTRRTLPCSVGCTAPQQARGPQAAAGALSLDRPGGSGTETTTAPQPRVEEVPQGVAEHV